MLTKKTQNLLKSVSCISQSVILSYPITTVSETDKSVIAFLDLSESEPTEFDRIGIYFVNELLTLMSYFDGENTVSDGKNLLIKGDDGECVYETTDLKIMEDKFWVEPEKLEKIKEANSVFEFEINKEFLQKINKVSTLLQHQNAVIDFRTDETEIILTNFTALDKYMSPSKFKLGGQKTQDGVAVLSMDTLNSIPPSNYLAKIIVSPKGNFSLLLEDQLNPIHLLVSILKQFPEA